MKIDTYCVLSEKSIVNVLFLKASNVQDLERDIYAQIYKWLGLTWSNNLFSSDKLHRNCSDNFVGTHELCQNCYHELHRNCSNKLCQLFPRFIITDFVGVSAHPEDDLIRWCLPSGLHNYENNLFSLSAWGPPRHLFFIKGFGKIYKGKFHRILFLPSSAQTGFS